MKILLLTLLFAAAYSSEEKCKGLYINENYYTVQIVKDGINKIHDMVYNRNNNTVYFTFEQLGLMSTRELGYVRLNDSSSGVIDGVKNATALAMDQNNNRLYIGGSDGLYFLSLNLNSKPRRFHFDDDIRSLFFKDGIAYFVNSKQEAYKFEYSLVKPVPELQGFKVDKFILDDDNNIMFLQNNKINRVRFGTGIPVSSNGYVNATDIAVDVNFKPYVSAKDGLYVYNKDKYVLEKFGDFKDIKKLAFISSDEPIYVVVDTLVRLIKNPVPCYGD